VTNSAKLLAILFVHEI
jgi:hypothetical protein